MIPTEVYVRLLNQGAEASRPTLAEELGGGLYKLFPTPEYDAGIEAWEFVPGSMVRGEQRSNSAGETFLLAVKL